MGYLMQFIKSVQKTLYKKFWERLDNIFQNCFLNFQISCISTPFKEEISILSHIAKKLQARTFLQNYFLKTFWPNFKRKFRLYTNNNFFFKERGYTTNFRTHKHFKEISFLPKNP